MKMHKIPKEFPTEEQAGENFLVKGILYGKEFFEILGWDGNFWITGFGKAAHSDASLLGWVSLKEFEV
jgi:hypothetical protein